LKEVEMESREHELERKIDWIDWREPVMVQLINDHTIKQPRFGCRFCIAMYGIKGSEIINLPASREEFDKHMKEEHPLP
jgi:hypothetical protein